MPGTTQQRERHTPLVLVETADLPRDDWLNYRRRGIGGSDVAAIMGVSPFRTARDIYYDKLGVAVVEPDDSNWVALEVGHLLEDLVAKIFSKKTGYRVYQIKKMFYHPVYHFMLADVDYFVELPDGTTAILEIKTTNYNAKDNWWMGENEIVPEYYELQGRHYMAVMDVDRVFFCCLYGNTEEEVIIREVKRDGAIEAEMIYLEQEFWVENVCKQIQPPYMEDGDLVIPIDGIVVTYNDVAYSKSCGRTGHHYKDGIAFKFEDDLFETRLRAIEWTPSRFGPIAPVAVLDPVIIEGCEVTHASLHNVSFIESKELAVGCRVLISKRNMIIPQIEENLDRGGYVASQVIPAVCPCCKQPTTVREGEPDKDGKIVKVLYCDNEDCDSRKLKKFVHFVSKKAMNIEGLAEGTLEKLIGRGWLHSFMDIYELDRHREEIIAMDGFGKKSWQNIWDAIQKSRTTSFERFLIAMDIPLIGNNASRTLSQTFHGDLDAFVDAVEEMYDFRQLPDIGETLHNNIYQWFWNEENYCMWFEMRDLITIEKPGEIPRTVQENPFMGKTIVVTGKVEPYTRDEIHGIIESLGAHAGSSVSGKTNYLICGEKAGSKLDKARSLGVQVITPLEFFSMVQAA